MGSMGHSLPPADSPNLSLLIATPEEKVECIKSNGQSWKGPLTVDQYIGREDHLIRQDMTKDGAMTCWVLVDRTLPPDCRPILSSCETIAKRAFLAYNGKVEDVVSQDIGSVFCRPEHRGRGYANRMIAELTKIIDTWQQEKTARKKIVFSVLYSDIGKTFYAAHGWKPFPSDHLTLPPTANAQLTNGNGGGYSFDKSLLRDMTAEDVRRQMCSDAMMEHHREKLREASKNSTAAKVAFPPDAAHMFWHWAREEYYSRILLPEKGEVRIKGTSVPSRKVFVCWNRNFGVSKEECTLYILRTLYEEPSSASERQAVVEALVAAFRRAQTEAHEWGMGHVEIWNPTPLVQEAIKTIDASAELVHRGTKSVASLKWDGKQFGLGDSVDWIWNERYGWA